MKIKKCVGAVIYDDNHNIFLMTSHKWKEGKAYTIPGGGINEGESEEAALHREITKEELKIEISDLVRVGEITKPASDDFYKKDIEFHFIDYFAKALSTKVIPNEEIDKCNWFSPEYALKNLEIIDTTIPFIKKFIEYRDNILKKRI